MLQVKIEKDVGGQESHRFALESGKIQVIR